MDFFQEQQKAKSQTGKLLGLLGLATLCIIMAVYILIRLFFYPDSTSSPYDTPPPFIDLQLLIPVALVISLMIFIGSITKVLQLRGGGKQVALSLGGRPIPPDTKDFDERKVLNVVEEMAIASGISPPPVYLLPEKTSINAFAAGFNPENAVIGITEGAIHALTRDQLQGVMAHEFSHILNGDMRLNIRLIGILNGILLLSIFGEILMRSGSHSRKKDGAGIVAFGIGLLIIGQIGVFFGHLIKQAISRQREYLADASAVQFTRDPLGLAGALKKIGGLHKQGSLIRHPKAETASHMFFSNGLRRQASYLGATHPPLKERVKRIEPGFDGQWPVIEPATLFKLAPDPEQNEPASDASSPMPDFFPGAPIPENVKPILTGVLMAGDSVAKDTVNQVGNPQRKHLDAAQHLLQSIPEALHTATRNPLSAQCLIFALLINRIPEDESKKELTQSLLTPDNQETFNELSTAARSLSAGLVLPLAELCLAGLRELNRQETEYFLKEVQRIIEHDGSLDLFEYALSHTLHRSLKANWEKKSRTPIRIYSLQGVRSEFQTLLSAMAQLGAQTPDEKQQAFQAGLEALNEPGPSFTRLTNNQINLKEIDQTLQKLEQVAFPVRKKILQACLACLTSDGTIRMEEAELYRAFAASMGCPTPLWVAPEGL